MFLGLHFFISSSIFWQCSCIFPLLVSFEFWSILWNSGQLAFSVLKLSVGGDSSSSSSSPIRVVRHGRWSDPPVSSSVSHLTASYGKLFVVIVRSIAVCDCLLVSAILVGSPVLIMREGESPRLYYLYLCYIPDLSLATLFAHAKFVNLVS